MLDAAFQRQYFKTLTATAMFWNKLLSFKKGDEK